MNPPNRAFELTINIGADNWEELLVQLNFLNIHIEDHGPECNSTSGSPSAYHTVLIRHDAAMTNERYHQELEEYLVHRDAKREAERG